MLTPSRFSIFICWRCMRALQPARRRIHEEKMAHKTPGGGHTTTQVVYMATILVTTPAIHSILRFQRARLGTLASEHAPHSKHIHQKARKEHSRVHKFYKAKGQTTTPLSTEYEDSKA